jgi:uncharacterized protein YbjT (DUF2867 family)
MILVTGASGQIGSLVVQNLIKRGVRVRALVRSGQSAKFENHSCLEVCIGSFENSGSMESALQGVECLFLIGRDNPNQALQHENIIKIAERNDVAHVVKLSAYGASLKSPISLMHLHAKTEGQLQQSRMSWTFLRPHLFMQNLLRFGQDIAANNSFTAPMGPEKYSLVDVRDVAEAAACVLADQKNHASKIYTLTGSEAVSYYGIAKHLTELLGHSIQYNSVTSSAFHRRLLDSGASEWRANDLANIKQAYPNGSTSTITDDISKLIGRPPIRITEFLFQHVRYFKTDKQKHVDFF